MLIALFTENIVFSRALGSSWVLYLTKNPKDLWHCTWILTLISVVSAAAGYPLRNLIIQSEHAYVLVPMSYIGCMAFFYIIVFFSLKAASPGLFERIEGKLGGAVFNCAVLGSLLIPASQRLDLFSSLGYAVGSSIGFTLAAVITGYGMERLSLRHIPKAFRGLPIALIYMGLLSLAFYGLIGHQLPT